MREIDGGVCGWEKEGDWKRERERKRGSETDVPKLYPTMNMNSLWYIYNIYIFHFAIFVIA